MDDNQRQERVDRARKAELQKVELCIQDTEEIEINTRILKKLSRKSLRHR
jgi:hypothetical protein